MRICVIFNPAARGERAKRFRQNLAAFERQCVVKITEGPGSARLLASEAVADGFVTIVAAGGDGTINEVLNGIGDVPDGLIRARLAVLPAGTVNVFAREIGLPLSLRRAWESILSGREESIDVARMQFERPGGTEVRYFLQMAGAGWDARAIEAVSWALKKRIGQFAYMVAGLKVLGQKLPLITVAEGTNAFSGQLVILGNGRFYGGQIPVFHRANPCDGLLDVSVFPKINWFVLARYFWGYLSPRLYRPGKEPYFQTPLVQIRSEHPSPVQLEGELVGHLPASCSVQRQALRIIVPQQRSSP